MEKKSYFCTQKRKKVDSLTQKEKDYIAQHCRDMSIGEMALSLGRNYFTIQKETSAIGFHRFHRWTPEEDALLFELWDTFCAEYIARRLKVDANCVYNRVRRLKKNGTWKQLQVSRLTTQP